jgi:hypothetical protein
MKRIFVTGLALLMLAGCSGGRKIVPVSGMVRVNGQPYPNAIVSFQPVGTDGDQNPGRGSSAKTGPDGRFTLSVDGQTPGALTGKHRVRISTDLGAGGTPKEGFDSDPNWRPGRMVEIIPAEWHDLSKHEFDVPAGGTDQANFDIETKTPPK